MNRSLRRTLTVFAAGFLPLLLAAGAIAYWTGIGSGAANATSATPVALALSPATPVAALYPGGQSTVSLTASNPNLFSVRIGSLALDTAQGTSGFTVDGGHSGCGLGTLSFTTQTNGGAGWTVPAKVGAVNGSLSISLSNALAMTASAANACQGATFTVYLVALA